jgi:serine/threonine protein kinase
MVSVEAGTIVGGKYALLRPLGRGSMGEVWLAQHQTLGEEVAIKLLAPSFPGDEYEDRASATARFRFEAQIAARLSRKTRHIVRVTDYGDEDGVAYLVMELLVGRTLETFFMQYGSMTMEAASGLVRQVARALEHAHAESVVHRDLKPANLFVTYDEDGGMLVKVLDFGIARTIRTQRLSIPSGFSTGQGLIFGTPGYMSPEQARAARIDARTDLWAFATVIYEALTGDLPLAGVTADELVKNLCAGVTVPVHQRDPTLPVGLADFFARAFALNIEDRFATAPELAAAFEGALHTAPAAIAPTGASHRPLPVVSAPTLLSGSSPSAAAMDASTWTAAGTLEMPRVKTGVRGSPRPPSTPPPPAVAPLETSPWPRRAMLGTVFAAMAAVGLLLPSRYGSQRAPQAAADVRADVHRVVAASADGAPSVPPAGSRAEPPVMLSPLPASPVGPAAGEEPTEGPSHEATAPEEEAPPGSAMSSAQPKPPAVAPSRSRPASSGAPGAGTTPVAPPASAVPGAASGLPVDRSAIL